MTNIIDLNSKRPKPAEQPKEIDPAVQNLVNFGYAIDEVFLKYLENTKASPEDLAAIIGHRLGEIMLVFSSEPEMLWEVVSGVITERLRRGK